MKTVLISLITVLCALIWSGFSRFDLYDTDDSDITWDEIDEDLWP
ncbi:hypothetical protein [Larkinella sp. C7]|jgi:hypothetical protein|nr:hypothetical protein [Larkinella sp. C7]